MTLRDVVLDRVARELGAGAKVEGWLVDHSDRCVTEVLLADGPRVAVKAYADETAAAREIATLRAARAGGVTVPAVLVAWTDRPAGFAMEWVDGEWLAPGRPARAWAAAGATLRQFHDLVVPGLSFPQQATSWAEGMMAWFDRERAGALDAGGRPPVVDAVARELDRMLYEPDIPIRTLHVDCGPIHWRLDGDERVVGLLDVETAMLGDPVYDLAVLTLRDRGRLAAVLDGYGAGAPLRRWIERALPMHRAFRFVGEVAWLAEHDYDPATALAALDEAVATLP